jgi:hypothetical protein
MKVMMAGLRLFLIMKILAMDKNFYFREKKFIAKAKIKF